MDNSPKQPIRTIEMEHPELSIVRPTNGNADFLPTVQAYTDLMDAYGHFNRELFDDKLPDCMFTMTRKPGMLGYFKPNAFQHIDGRTSHEICMNPSYLRKRPMEVTLSTLVHEMVHLWRHDSGKLNQRGTTGSPGYHDTVWADEMEHVGLMPSDTAMPGGRRTGSRVSHYIIPNGRFKTKCTALLARDFIIHWGDFDRKSNEDDKSTMASEQDNSSQKPMPKKDRVKFTCLGCRLNAWAKPAARFRCNDCDAMMHTLDL